MLIGYMRRGDIVNDDIIVDWHENTNVGKREVKGEGKTKMQCLLV